MDEAGIITEIWDEKWRYMDEKGEGGGYCVHDEVYEKNNFNSL